jgi:hypothetical protein
MCQRIRVSAWASRIVASLVSLTAAGSFATTPPGDNASRRWVATWATAQPLATAAVPAWLSKPPPQKASTAESAGKAPERSPVATIPERLDNQTVRMVARVSIGGRQLRIRLSNARGFSAVTIGAARVAVATRSNSAGVIRPGSDRAITVAGRQTFTIEPGAMIVSDPVDLSVAALSDRA